MTFWIVAVLAVSAASITLARSKMLISYRRLMMNIHEEMYNLSRCHYCTAHWLSAAVVAVYRPIVGGVFWCDLLLAWLAIVGGSALISGIILALTPFSSKE